MKTPRIFLFFIFIIFLTLISSCGNGNTDDKRTPPEDAIYENVVFLPLSIPDEYYQDLLRTDGIYAKLITTEPGFLEIAAPLGITQNSSALYLYDEAYFEDRDLLFVAFFSGTDVTLSINEFTLSPDSVLAVINTHTPKVSNLPGLYQGIYFELEKGLIAETMRIDVELEGVLTE